MKIAVPSFQFHPTAKQNIKMGNNARRYLGIPYKEFGYYCGGRLPCYPKLDEGMIGKAMQPTYNMNLDSAFEPSEYDWEIINNCNLRWFEVTA